MAYQKTNSKQTMNTLATELVLKAALYQVQLQNLQIKCREEHEASETSKVSETTELHEGENDANPDSNS